jgi:hypothetical protein
VIRLNATDCNQRIGAGRNRVGYDDGELSHLVSAKPEGNGIVPFHQDAWRDTQRVAQTFQLFDRRGKVTE